MIPTSFSDLFATRKAKSRSNIFKVGEAQVCTSIIVAAEMRYGAEKKPSPRLSAQLDAVLGRWKFCHFRNRPT